MSLITNNDQVDERTLQYDCVRRIRESFSISVGHEVPLLGRTVDLVYIKNDIVVSIEFKLRDWKKAISQARDHLLGADYAYICMPRRTITDGLRQELEEAGVGLVFYKDGDDWPFEVVISAPKSKDTWMAARSMLIEYVNNKRG
jgi:hypothetical protein